MRKLTALGSVLGCLTLCVAKNIVLYIKRPNNVKCEAICSLV